MRTTFPHSYRYLLALALVLPASSAAADEAGPIVRADTGSVSGVRDARAGLDEFKGIPYAAPPVGAQRWKPPQPTAAWKGVRTAEHFGPRCMQRPVYSDQVFHSDGMSEDCLYLNVWKPAHAGNGKLPVLVYFYGGAFITGDSSEARYDGASLARHGIVTVTVNYRLDVFGFLALPALAAESPAHATGNYGLLDQVAALRWVQRNIAAFGGDPQQVTIGGESAGSMSVSALMASPLSKGLMQRAIGESGGVFGQRQPALRTSAERQGEAYMQHVGAHSLADLRAMKADVLLKACGDEGVTKFGLTIDGELLPRSPTAIYEAGTQAHIPLLVGSNSQEGDWKGLFDDKAPTPGNYRAAVQQEFGTNADEVLRVYPGRNEAEVQTSATALAGDRFMGFPSWRWMHLQYEKGDGPVYYYHFEQPRPARRDGSAGPDAGAVHSGEIEYALGNLDGNPGYAWTATDLRVSAVMEGYFANFIKTGNPNGPGLPHWPAVANRDGGLLRQAIGADTHSYVDRDAARNELLQRVDPDASL
ncbi:carboxylesterase family protein [Dyella solisilvae]|uniref:Carboxylic ester hydrolase n=1 Tax=Dyella solisilvae TaxID=1920168 RepID=A0A370KB81_9GAMM|nr:carboxylesterase family protein [Dyella solisilvae]RDI99300.1 carboxylesterase family protein [Dyella solisilvae]